VLYVVVLIVCTESNKQERLINIGKVFIGTKFVKLIIRLIGGGLAPYSPTVGILMENPLVGKARQENDLSRAPMDLTNSEFDEQLYYQVYAKLLATVTHDRQKCTCLAILGNATQLGIFP
jgi:hypothetical protein